jgi:hypothetical protein
MSIFDYSLLSQIIPAFLLIFVLVFAILQKSQLLGDAAQKANLIISFAIGVLFIIAAPARNFVIGVMPFLAIALAVMLSFLILWGFIAGKDWASNKWMKPVFGILIGIFIVAVVLYVSGVWADIDDIFLNWFGTGFWSGLILLVIIGGAVFFVMKGKAGS